MTATILGQADEFDQLDIPLFLDSVSAGFPSPASDYAEKTLDLNELCINKPAATYFVRAQGESMIETGIFHNDVLVVDRSLTARHGDIVIAEFNGEFLVKQLQLKPQLQLLPMNKHHRPIVISDGSDFEIFGVVTFVVHNLRSR